MLLTILIVTPLIGIIYLLSLLSYDMSYDKKHLKSTALFFLVLNLIISLIVWILFDNNCLYFQFLQERFTVINYDESGPWGLFYQDDTTPLGGLEELYNNIIFFLSITLLAVALSGLTLILFTKDSTDINKDKNNNDKDKVKKPSGRRPHPDETEPDPKPPVTKPADERPAPGTG